MTIMQSHCRMCLIVPLSFKPYNAHKAYDSCMHAFAVLELFLLPIMLLILLRSKVESLMIFLFLFLAAMQVKKTAAVYRYAHSKNNLLKFTKLNNLH